MISLVFGGSGSGKSEFAEGLLSAVEQKFYIATMKRCDGETENRIIRHRRLREGKGFTTVECPCNIEEALKDRQNLSSSSALLECLSNLLANEMFSENNAGSLEHVGNRILCGIKKLCADCRDFIIVSNNVFDDGVEYDDMTKLYIQTLSKLNCELATIADKVYEVVCGIPLEVK